MVLIKPVPHISAPEAHLRKRTECRGQVIDTRMFAVSPLYFLLDYTYDGCGGGGSVFGIAKRYGLDGQGIESQWGRYLPHRSRLALGPTQPPIQWVPGVIHGSKAAGAWR